MKELKKGKKRWMEGTAKRQVIGVIATIIHLPQSYQPPRPPI